MFSYFPEKDGGMERGRAGSAGRKGWDGGRTRAPLSWLAGSSRSGGLAPAERLWERM